MMICSEGYLGNAGSGCNFQGLQVLQATCSFSGMFRKPPKCHQNSTFGSPAAVHGTNSSMGRG